jgi:CHAT domain-containing protein
MAEHAAAPSGETSDARRTRLQRASTTLGRVSRELGDALIAPAAALLRNRTRLLIVADGNLQALPFALLPSPGALGRPLGSVYELVRLPSASVGVALRARAATRARASERIAVFADPVFSRPSAVAAPSPTDEWLPRLRFSRTEADAIARLAPRRTELWTDFAADRSAALGAGLEQFDIVHLAAHAVIDNDRPQLSGIVLSQVDRDGAPRNGVVRLHELYNLALNARLVVLSACRTAVGRAVDGEGLVGFARGYLHAGADAMVGTLWDVDDRATAAFMSRFYAALLSEKRSPAAALRLAREALRADARFAQPHDWAGFVLVGHSQ